MSATKPRPQERDHLRLVDPLENAELLNSRAQEVLPDELNGAEIMSVIEDMLWLAAGKDEEGGAQMVY